MSTVTKERAINARDWEVRALLNGSKTQWRFPVKPQPTWSEPIKNYLGTRVTRAAGWDWHDEFFHDNATDGQRLFHFMQRCPYAVGSRLVIREAFRFEPPFVVRYKNNDCIEHANVAAQAKAEAERTWSKFSRWRSAGHMPRWASRITLEITDVRVEKLGGISEEDAQAEGYPGTEVDGKHIPWSGLGWFHAQWEVDRGSWNPELWVWALTFKRVSQQAD